MKHLLIICLLLFVAGCSEFAGDPGLAYWQVQQVRQQNSYNTPYSNPPIFPQYQRNNNFWQEQYYMQKAIKKPQYNSSESQRKFMDDMDRRNQQSLNEMRYLLR